MGQVTKLGRVCHVIKKSETSFRHFRHVTDKFTDKSETCFRQVWRLLLLKTCFL